MYLVVIAWMYVVLMMSVAEATNTTGTVLGAIVTFIFYGLLPMGLVVYIMATPGRKRKIKAREAAELAASQQAAGEGSTGLEGSPEHGSALDPDASGHSASATEASGVTPVRKEP